ncbi:hypothetical protein L208DRAFT_64415 [Tricholoma matsutake]|nr:hypothetical protein L208DRAFT_64415 [Tricholoma matsutake 945]
MRRMRILWLVIRLIFRIVMRDLGRGVRREVVVLGRVLRLRLLLVRILWMMMRMWGFRLLGRRWVMKEMWMWMWMWMWMRMWMWMVMVMRGVGGVQRIRLQWRRLRGLMIFLLWDFWMRSRNRNRRGRRHGRGRGSKCLCWWINRI